MNYKSVVRITANLALFPFLYPLKKTYPTLAEHFSVRDSVPDRADIVAALGCSLRADGTASRPTRATADRAAELYKKNTVQKILLSGGNPVNGVSEGEAMRRVIERDHGLKGEDIVIDRLPLSTYVGTLDQVRSIAEILKGNGAKKVILVVQPQQLPRALWLFRKMIPGVEFYPANPAEEYDKLSTQVRMHSAWRFRIWNMIAWSGLWRQDL